MKLARPVSDHFAFAAMDGIDWGSDSHNSSGSQSGDRSVLVKPVVSKLGEQDGDWFSETAESDFSDFDDESTRTNSKKKKKRRQRKRPSEKPDKEDDLFSEADTIYSTKSHRTRATRPEIKSVVKSGIQFEFGKSLDFDDDDDFCSDFDPEADESVNSHGTTRRKAQEERKKTRESKAHAGKQSSKKDRRKKKKSLLGDPEDFTSDIDSEFEGSVASTTTKKKKKKKKSLLGEPEDFADDIDSEFEGSVATNTKKKKKDRRSTLPVQLSDAEKDGKRPIRGRRTTLPAQLSDEEEDGKRSIRGRRTTLPVQLSDEEEDAKPHFDKGKNRRPSMANSSVEDKNQRPSITNTNIEERSVRGRRRSTASGLMRNPSQLSLSRSLCDNDRTPSQRSLHSTKSEKTKRSPDEREERSRRGRRSSIADEEDSKRSKSKGEKKKAKKRDSLLGEEDSDDDCESELDMSRRTKSSSKSKESSPLEKDAECNETTRERRSSLGNLDSLENEHSVRGRGRSILPGMDESERSRRRERSLARSSWREKEKFRAKGGSDFDSILDKKFEQAQDANRRRELLDLSRKGPVRALSRQRSSSTQRSETTSRLDSLLGGKDEEVDEIANRDSSVQRKRRPSALGSACSSSESLYGSTVELETGCDDNSYLPSGLGGSRRPSIRSRVPENGGAMHRQPSLKDVLKADLEEGMRRTDSNGMLPDKYNPNMGKIYGGAMGAGPGADVLRQRSASASRSRDYNTGGKHESTIDDIFKSRRLRGEVTRTRTKTGKDSAKKKKKSLKDRLLFR